MKNLITILIAAVGFMASFCHKEPPLEPSVSMQFILPMTVRPVQPTYHIGDTIWLEASFSDSIYERTTDKKYRFVDFDFASTIFLFKLMGRPAGSLGSMPFAGTQFEFYPQIGNISLLNTGADMAYEYINNTYNCRIGIIPKQMGVFAFYSTSWWISFQSELDLSFIDLGYTLEGGRRSPYLQGFYHIVNEGVNVNSTIYSQNCIPFGEANNYTELSVLEDKMVFAFEVVK